MHCTTESQSLPSTVQKSPPSGRVQRVRYAELRSTSASSSTQSQDFGFFRSEVNCAMEVSSVRCMESTVETIPVPFGLFARESARSDISGAQLSIVMRVPL